MSRSYFQPKIKRHEDIQDVVCVKNGNNIFLNLTIPHKPGAVPSAPSNAEFFQVRREGLLNGPASNYSLSVVRFTIPTVNIPIQICPIDPQLYTALPTNRNINQSSYGIQIEWDGNFYSVPLQWITQNLESRVPNPEDVENKLANFYESGFG